MNKKEVDCDSITCYLFKKGRVDNEKIIYFILYDNRCIIDWLCGQCGNE